MQTHKDRLPNTSSSGVLFGSPDTDHSNSAWDVHFGGGYPDNYGKRGSNGQLR